MKSVVILSSLVYGLIEYAPGKSTISILFPKLSFNFASFLLTVTPAQLPTYSCFPVRALYSVVFPLFGFPANAIFIPSSPLFKIFL